MARFRRLPGPRWVVFGSSVIVTLSLVAALDSSLDTRPRLHFLGQTRPIERTPYNDLAGTLTYTYHLNCPPPELLPVVDRELRAAGFHPVPSHAAGTYAWRRPTATLDDLVTMSKGDVYLVRDPIAGELARTESGGQGTVIQVLLWDNRSEIAQWAAFHFAQARHR